MSKIERLRSYLLPAFIVFLSSVSAVGCNKFIAPEDHDAPPGSTATAHSHETADETCFVCDPSKRDPQRLWCKEHGRYEDRCFSCHPEIEDKERLYCDEHFLYEDECFLCHPELSEQPEQDTVEPQALEVLDALPSRAELSDLAVALYCNEHNVREDECGICHPDLIASRGIGESLKIRFASPESAGKAGVRTGRPNQAQVTIGELALGQLTFNMNKLAMVTPLAGGVIRDIFVDVGQFVEEGQLLAEVNSTAVANAKSDLVKALAETERARLAYERKKDLLMEGVTTKQDSEDAKAVYVVGTSEVDRARQQLLNLGFTEEEVAGVEKTRSTSSVLPLRAPFDGSIIKREAVLGTAVEVGTPVFQIADLTSMWLELSVAESEAVQLRAGAEVHANFDAFPGEIFDGKLIWIASHVDEVTRTVNARALLANKEGRLKSGLFGSAIIKEATLSNCLTVPFEAVQNIDGQTIVFAKLEDDLYEAKVVETGPVMGDHISITGGLSQSDEIVLSESYILKSELLKAKLGAGCVDE